jgi:predicted Fe-Mo cluster-binding NifX family protein
MRIAIPESRGRVSPVFDAARHLWVVDIENGRETARSTTFLSQRGPLERAKHVYYCGVKVLICGAISWTLLLSLSSHGVKVIPFICGSIEEIVSAFCQDRLSDDRYHMPGVKDWKSADNDAGTFAAKSAHQWVWRRNRGSQTPKPL